MAERDDHSEGTFKVTDRRKFTMDGELRPTGEVETAAAAAPAPAPTPPPKAVAEEPPSSTGIDTPFEHLILSFTQSAMMQLGLVALDPTQPLEPDLMGARETIDMLAVLEEKTRGNLTSRESRLLTQTLVELRLAFVGVERGLKTRP